MGDCEGKGFRSIRVVIDSVDVIICKVLACTKGNPNVHILAQGGQLMKLTYEDRNYISVKSVHQTVGTAIQKSVLYMDQQPPHDHMMP